MRKRSRKVKELEQKFNKLLDRFVALEANLYVHSKQMEEK